MRIWLALIIAVLLIGSGAYIYFREPAAPTDTASSAIDRLLAGKENVAVAAWLGSGKLGNIDISGRFARATIIGEGGREAIVLLIQSQAGIWSIISVSEGAPACSAVPRYGFPLSLIKDCTVGAVSTVADALAAGSSGGKEIRVFGVVELSSDPSCSGCIFLSSGGVSVRLDVSLSDLEKAGIHLGDSVVVSGGLSENLVISATSVMAVGSDSGSGASGNNNTETSGNNQNSTSPTSPTSPSAPKTTPNQPPVVVPEPTVAPTQSPDVSPPQPGAPRRYKPTTWYTNPLDLDTSAIEIVQPIDANQP